jgi:hypothetical protein
LERHGAGWPQGQSRERAEHQGKTVKAVARSAAQALKN